MGEPVDTDQDQSQVRVRAACTLLRQSDPQGPVTPIKGYQTFQPPGLVLFLPAAHRNTWEMSQTLHTPSPVPASVSCAAQTLYLEGSKIGGGGRGGVGRLVKWVWDDVDSTLRQLAMKGVRQHASEMEVCLPSNAPAARCWSPLKEQASRSKLQWNFSLMAVQQCPSPPRLIYTSHTKFTKRFTFTDIAWTFFVRGLVRTHGDFSPRCLQNWPVNAYAPREFRIGRGDS